MNNITVGDIFLLKEVSNNSNIIVASPIGAGAHYKYDLNVPVKNILTNYSHWIVRAYESNTPNHFEIHIKEKENFKIISVKEDEENE